MLAYLGQHYDIKVLDLRPNHGGYAQVVGDATDPGVLASAMEGIDAVIHCAMGAHEGSSAAHQRQASMST